jgi:hypothetical protein
MRHCMKRRLLYASSQAYQPRMETIGRSVGWLEPPIEVRREIPVGHRAIDVALVGRVPEGVVVAFRGTLAPFFDKSNDGAEDGIAVLLDWFNDSLAVCVEDPAYAGGGVHLGFADSMRRLWSDLGDEPGVKTLIQRMLDQSLLDRRAARHLFVTGHSKGGALANLAAFRAARITAWDAMPISVATIAAARAGNAAFARAYAETRIACLRYELASDLVPHLPPGPQTPAWVHGLVRQFAPRLATADYHPVGLLVTGRPGGGHRGWSGSRRRILPSLLGPRGLGLATFVPALAAHAICPDSGYDQLVCEGEDGCDHGMAAARFPLRGGAERNAR